MPTADYEEKVENILEMVRNSERIHQENAKLLRQYRRDQGVNGMSAATQQRNLSYLKVVCLLEDPQVKSALLERMSES